MALREKSPNTDFFSSNTGKYGPEKTPYLDTFHGMWESHYLLLLVTFI